MFKNPQQNFSIFALLSGACSVLEVLWNSLVPTPMMIWLALAAQKEEKIIEIFYHNKTPSLQYFDLLSSEKFSLHVKALFPIFMQITLESSERRENGKYSWKLFNINYTTRRESRKRIESWKYFEYKRKKLTNSLQDTKCTRLFLI